MRRVDSQIVSYEKAIISVRHDKVGSAPQASQENFIIPSGIG